MQIWKYWKVPALCLAALLLWRLPQAGAESRITALAPDQGQTRAGSSTAVNARLRFEVEIPRVLTVESTDTRSRISTNNGTTLGQCVRRTTAESQPRCHGSGVGSSGINEWEAPRGMTAVAQP